MSIRSNPFEELERVFESMSRQLAEVGRSWDERLPRSMEWLAGGPMAVDVVDEGDAFTVAVDLPGWDREDVDVRVSDRTLRIRAARDEAEEVADERYLRRERRRESMHRSVQLPEAVDTGAVTARMRNGVLTVRVPKREPTEEAKRIAIESE